MLSMLASNQILKATILGVHSSSFDAGARDHERGASALNLHRWLTAVLQPIALAVQYRIHSFLSNRCNALGCCFSQPNM